MGYFLLDMNYLIWDKNCEKETAKDHKWSSAFTSLIGPGGCDSTSENLCVMSDL